MTKPDSTPVRGQHKYMAMIDDDWTFYSTDTAQILPEEFASSPPRLLAPKEFWSDDFERNLGYEAIWEDLKGKDRPWP